MRRRGRTRHGTRRRGAARRRLRRRSRPRSRSKGWTWRRPAASRKEPLNTSGSTNSKHVGAMSGGVRGRGAQLGGPWPAALPWSTAEETGPLATGAGRTTALTGAARLDWRDPKRRRAPGQPCGPDRGRTTRMMQFERTRSRDLINEFILSSQTPDKWQKTMPSYKATVANKDLPRLTVGITNRKHQVANHATSLRRVDITTIYQSANLDRKLIRRLRR